MTSSNNGNNNAPTIDEQKAQDNKTFSTLRGKHCFDNILAAGTTRVAISFTGGKDCHLALQRGVDAGLQIVCGVMFYVLQHTNTMEAHRMKWQRIQGTNMGIPIVDGVLEELNNTKSNYMEAYAAAIRKVQEKYDIQYIITGDIDYIFTSTDNFMQQVCTQFDTNGVQVLLPLWQQSRQDLLQEMLSQSFDIRFSCVKTPHFDETWIGRCLDSVAIQEMEQNIDTGLDLAGENGEYHTMVIDGPMYRQNNNTPLQFVDAQPHELQDHWGRTKGERWWVISKEAKLVPRDDHRQAIERKAIH